MTTSNVMLRALAAHGMVRVLAIDATNVATEVVQRHSLKALSAKLASELVVANLLMGAFIKGEERVSLQLQAETPRCAFMGEVDAEGGVRGRFLPEQIGRHNEIDGLMFTIKHNAEREMYRGITPVKHKTIEQALRDHLLNSDQVHAVVRIDVEMASPGVMKRVQGLLIERLPEDKERLSLPQADFDARFGVLQQVESLAPLLETLADGQISDSPVEILEVRPLTFRCRCSRDKVVAAIFSLNVETLQAMKDEDKGAEVTCDYCNTTYRLTEQDLGDMIQAKAEQSADA